ncbi:MAG: hypothetical protein H7Y30_09370 [Pyrinomonadaceae bacterium]|nr:hypothetical protein [Pyrinomonadaceae bacterium]
MDTSLPLTEEFEADEAYQPLRLSSTPEKRETYEASEPEHELGLWLQSLRSFFQARNHPFAEAEQATVLARDWASELVIARRALLRISQLALRLVHLEDETESAGTADDNLLDGLGLTGAPQRAIHRAAAQSLVDLSEAVSDMSVLCETLLDAPRVGFYTWATVGKVLARELGRSEAAQALMRSAQHASDAKLPVQLLDLAHAPQLTAALGADILIIFSDLSRLLEKLRMVETSLRRDHPLKQTLPLFCLVYEEARSLLDFIETRALRTEGLDEAIFDALDGTNYAIAMELRKVFSHELIGLSSLRQSPPIYAKVENAHGLLRNCFQQSIVALAQLFDPALDGARLFSAFQTKLDQSMSLRSDLWTLLQLTRRAEKERERHPISRVLERLNTFRDGSLRYLMYKDWEACERFIEEVAAARGAVEVTPVLHRFGAYLETLHGQVNMRAVLADYPFDYPPLEN